MGTIVSCMKKVMHYIKREEEQISQLRFISMLLSVTYVTSNIRTNVYAICRQTRLLKVSGTLPTPVSMYEMLFPIQCVNVRPRKCAQVGQMGRIFRRWKKKGDKGGKAKKLSVL